MLESCSVVVYIYFYILSKYVLSQYKYCLYVVILIDSRVQRIAYINHEPRVDFIVLVMYANC